MIAVKRKNCILERLQAEGSVLVASLSEEFGVSEETIRRDLAKLELEGFVSRGYGGAVWAGHGGKEPPYSIRKQINVAGKQRIAQQTARLISDGDFIMLDESSTAMFIASEIKAKRNITLITNSIEIIREVHGAQGWTVLCTGGALKQDIQALTGRQAEGFIRGYHVDTTIISCTGLDFAAGYTDAGEDNAFIKRAMMASADRTILAVDSHKFGRKAFAPIGKLSELSVIVTDAEPDDSWKNILADNNVELIFE